MTIISISHERAPQTLSLRPDRAEVAAHLGRAPDFFTRPIRARKDFDPAKPKFYVLDMFPYPSGAGLHVGHPEGYTATDIIARYKRMRGFNVLHPMGWDAFGLPAEQYAIKTGQHPAITTRENIAKFKTQLKRIGFSYDWQREINTTDPGYYKWTQWIFLQIYNSWFNPETNKAEPISTYRGDDPDSVRLAYVAEVPVNWCPELGTVLANEEVVDGKSEVGGFPVVRRPMRQWMLRITAYADRLIDELEGLDWPEGIKLLQRNWIGRSEGAEIDFKIDEAATQNDPRFHHAAGHALWRDLHGARAGTSTCRSNRHRRAMAGGARISRDAPRAKAISNAPNSRKKKPASSPAPTPSIRRTTKRSRSGSPTMCCSVTAPARSWPCPAHDERDLEFARKFDLPIRAGCSAAGRRRPHSDSSAMESRSIRRSSMACRRAEAKRKSPTGWKNAVSGKRAINYKLRDWLFSRQRYWGEPFPIVWDETANIDALGENELPVVPPALEDYKPTGTGEPPLAKAKDWVRYSDKATRETKHHAAMGRFVLVLPAFLRSAERSAFRRRRSRTLLDGRTDSRAGSIFTSAGRARRVCICFTRAFGTRCLFDLGYFRSRSRSSVW